MQIRIQHYSKIRDKVELQQLVLEIFNVTFKNNTKIDISLIPKENDKLVDRFGKIIDFHDWFATLLI